MLARRDGSRVDLAAGQDFRPRELLAQGRRIRRQEPPVRAGVRDPVPVRVAPATEGHAALRTDHCLDGAGRECRFQLGDGLLNRRLALGQRFVRERSGVASHFGPSLEIQRPTAAGSLCRLDAGRARPFAHARSRSTFSEAVFAIGTVFRAASIRSKVVIIRSPSAKAVYRASGTSAASSAPVKLSVASATACRLIEEASRLWASSAVFTIACRSETVGRSTKNSSSNRPFLRSSGGRAETSFAVATTKTDPCRSCIQERIVPRASEETPPSADPWVAPPKAFSISSSHTTQGETASATRRAFLMFPSDSPTHFDLSPPRSRRRSGIPQAVAIAFAVRLFPHPGTPTNKQPFGAGRPYARALAEKAARLLVSHAMRPSRPPTASRPPGIGSYHSKTFSRAITRFFSCETVAGSILRDWTSERA